MARGLDLYHLLYKQRAQKAGIAPAFCALCLYALIAERLFDCVDHVHFDADFLLACADRCGDIGGHSGCH